ncbi:MAG: hypothetical protein GX455_14815 [Phycisphaerae bacterium]|nr:hypothetical protein [Phycisphaerae bacterium]
MKSEPRLWESGRRVHLYHTGLVIMAILFLCGPITSNTLAASIDPDQARQAATGWLRLYPQPMESNIAGVPARVDPIGPADQPLGFIVRLSPAGFVVLSAEDRIDPIIAFSPTGNIDDRMDNPLLNLLNQDLSGRLAQIQADAERTPPPSNSADSESPQSRWQTLLSAGSDEFPPPPSFPSVSDLRVPPLIQSKWGQEDAASGHCYNYYTPNHYPTGCVATAMAQLMRYHSHPTAGIGVKSFTIYVNDVPQTRTTRGGNGTGGPYAWDQMPYDPEAVSLTTAQRQAIGALCHDAGVSVGAGYTATGTGASTADADEKLVTVFGYANSIYADINSGSLSDSLMRAINSNLDAALPVILSISSPSDGHAAIVDGYGYQSGQLLHHVNLGWTGLEDAWYALPPDTSFHFNTITGCVYNVFSAGAGVNEFEIVSGRITSLAGAPLAGVQITAYKGALIAKQTTTNARGIYALKNLASNTQFRIAASLAGYTFADQLTTTGKSQDWAAPSGNKWAVNFTATNPMPPTAFDQQVPTPSQQSVLVTLQALDDHLPNPPDKLTYAIVSLPEHGTLSDPGAGPIPAVPYNLANSGTNVRYTPCPYFGGSDSFLFKTNDGGIAPTGGDSNIATVTVAVDNQLYADFGTDASLGTNTMINTGFYASRSQVLYLQSDIGPAKILTDLAIDFTGIPPIPLNQWTIRMQHTDKNYYPYAPDDFLTRGWTMVYQGNLSITKTGWTNFHFATPFKYNGTQNLLIDFSFNNTAISAADTGWYLYNDVGDERTITVITEKPIHDDPLTWDFWYNDGWSYRDGWLPSIKLIGIIPIDPIPGDLDASCDVKLPDFARMAASWNASSGQTHYDSACDIATPKNNKIDLADLKLLASHWLSKYQ